MWQTTDPVPTTPLYDGADADTILEERIGLRREECFEELWSPTLRVMRQATRRYGEHAVPGAGGSEAFHRGTEELRINFRHYGWHAPKQFEQIDRPFPLATKKNELAALEATGLVVDQGCRFGISLVQGDGSTCRRDRGGPNVKHPRGYVPQSYFQGSLFGRNPVHDFEWLFFLHHITKLGWQAELIKPRAISKAGWVTEWDWGVVIVNEDFSTGPRDPAITKPIELDEPTVERRT